jgi:hypothetical protein
VQIPKEKQLEILKEFLAMAKAYSRQKEEAQADALLAKNLAELEK